ncbi:uncharacterized protein LOC109500042 isoform X1 [Felis catus]|uniref:uncharacterized protein LOC109500042 isoform X1 n=1 Tax=Felis catus TaxID=9685 RepID=UPI001D1A01C1|nr:uncharacterized protein LOC109500042 isoform X1 [Felis catus]
MKGICRTTASPWVTLGDSRHRAATVGRQTCRLKTATRTLGLCDVVDRIMGPQKMSCPGPQDLTHPGLLTSGAAGKEGYLTPPESLRVPGRVPGAAGEAPRKWRQKAVDVRVCARLACGHGPLSNGPNGKKKLGRRAADKSLASCFACVSRTGGRRPGGCAENGDSGDTPGTPTPGPPASPATQPSTCPAGTHPITRPGSVWSARTHTCTHTLVQGTRKHTICSGARAHTQAARARRGTCVPPTSSRRGPDGHPVPPPQGEATFQPQGPQPGRSEGAAGVRSVPADDNWQRHGQSPNYRSARKILHFIKLMFIQKNLFRKSGKRNKYLYSGRPSPT